MMARLRRNASWQRAVLSCGFIVIVFLGVAVLSSSLERGKREQAMLDAQHVASLWGTMYAIGAEETVDCSGLAEACEIVRGGVEVQCCMTNSGCLRIEGLELGEARFEEAKGYLSWDRGIRYEGNSL